ncbi:hypothetical protein AMTR_s00081p00023910 [Amborella trichopoda]|uniref:Uncharacterized protein n=1 Tax=Amborella trichopoda TaxID=13333 RepID=W1P3M6_AMBTC|nr:hypothetical protein AMTR_s00081p00023910 [Amborella trichopoda]
MAHIYLPPHQPTPLHPAGQPSTFGSNPWVSSAPVDMKYQSLERQMKVMRTTLQRLGLDNSALTETYDESCLNGFANLPMNFLPLEFQNRFNGKGDPQLHVTSYLLVLPAIRDKPIALKAMFVHSLARDAIT